MLTQFAIGSAIIVASILIQAVFVGIALRLLKNISSRELSASAVVFIVSLTTLWLLASISIVIWIWAVVFLSLEAFSTLETSVYFSIVSFTTLGYGDILLPDNLRILAGLIATNGFVLFGLTTAFLVEMILRIHRSGSNS